MSMYSTVVRRALLFAVLVPLLVAAGGLAHALFADNNPHRPALEYVWIGFLHIVDGWDHLLFILGVQSVSRHRHRPAS